MDFVSNDVRFSFQTCKKCYVIATSLCNKILYTSTDMKNYRQNGYKNEAAFQLRFPCPFKVLKSGVNALF